jgi:hypothetical protein
LKEKLSKKERERLDVTDSKEEKLGGLEDRRILLIDCGKLGVLRKE